MADVGDEDFVFLVDQAETRFWRDRAAPGLLVERPQRGNESAPLPPPRFHLRVAGTGVTPAL